MEKQLIIQQIQPNCDSLFLDALMDIPTSKADAKAEKEIADLKAQVHDLTKDLDSSNRLLTHLEGAAQSHRITVIALTALCIFLAISLVFYMALDAGNPNIGLFNNGTPLGFIFLIALILSVISVAFIGFSSNKQKENDKNE